MVTATPLPFLPLPWTSNPAPFDHNWFKQRSLGRDGNKYQNWADFICKFLDSPHIFILSLNLLRKSRTHPWFKVTGVYLQSFVLVVFPNSDVLSTTWLMFVSAHRMLQLKLTCPYKQPMNEDIWEELHSSLLKAATFPQFSEWKHSSHLSIHRLII